MFRHAMVLVAALCSFNAIAADSCMAVLSKDLKDKKLNYRSTHATEDTAKWFCSDEFEKQYKSGGGGFSITVPIEDIPVEFGADAKYDQSWEKRKAVCAANKVRFDLADVQYIYQEITSPHAWDAFVKCEKARPSVIGLNIDAKGDSLTVSAEFHPVGVMKPAVVESFAMAGATCKPNPFKHGAQILAGGAAALCTRQADGPVNFVLNTNYGPAYASLRSRVSGQAGNAKLVYTTDNVDANEKDDDPIVEVSQETWDVDSEHPHNTTLKLSVDAGKYVLREVTWGCREVTKGGGCPFHYFDTNSLKLGATSAEITVRNDGTRASVYLRGVRYKKRIVSRSQELPSFSLAYGKTFTVPVPRNASSAVLIGTLPTGGFAFDPTRPLSEIDGESFELVSKVETNSETVYVFRLKDQEQDIITSYFASSLYQMPPAEDYRGNAKVKTLGAHSSEGALAGAKIVPVAASACSVAWFPSCPAQRTLRPRHR